MGFHYAQSLISKVGMAVGLATDPADMVNQVGRPSHAMSRFSYYRACADAA